MPKSTSSKKPTKASLGKNFPLTPHPNGSFCKRINGKLHFFGPWRDPAAAKAKYLRQRAAIEAGRHPDSVTATGLTVQTCVNKFLTSKAHRRDIGELTHRSWSDYHGSCKVIVEAFGKERLVSDLTPDDFTHLRVRLAKTLGPVALGNAIQRVRTVMKHAAEEGWIEHPVKMGSSFRKPPKKVMRAERLKRGPKMFEARHIRRALKAADVQMRAMILLGVNAGLGNSDIGALPLSAIDLKTGWLTFPRPKTAIARKAFLWPETLEAVKAAIAKRTTPKSEDHEHLMFITKYGDSWLKDEGRANPLSAECRKLLIRIGIHRAGCSFYTLRHVCETIGGESKDHPALSLVMGHLTDDMASVYRERISDERLQDVAAVIRRWLFRRTGQNMWGSRNPLVSGSKRATARKKFR